MSTSAASDSVWYNVRGSDVAGLSHNVASVPVGWIDEWKENAP